jgi:predicted enzyme related to lactoylglutathione lyase
MITTRSVGGYACAQQPPIDLDPRLRSVTVCGLSAQPEMMKGMPPVWTSYVSVKSADDAVKKAESLGGKALAPAFDVMDAGRMAIIGDPTGAVIAVWQPNKHFGAKLANEPGSLCWNELNTHDSDKATAFYTELFDWKAKSAERIQSLGGKLLVEPTDVPGVGRFAVAQDPQGGAFCIIKLQPKAA